MLTKTSELKGQGELLQEILAKEQSRKSRNPWSFPNIHITAIRDSKTHPCSTTALAFSNPFYIQDKVGLAEVFRKSKSSFKYLPLRASTQSKGCLVINFQLSPASKDKFMVSIDLILRKSSSEDSLEGCYSCYFYLHYECISAA